MAVMSKPCSMPSLARGCQSPPQGPEISLPGAGITFRPICVEALARIAVGRTKRQQHALPGLPLAFDTQTFDPDLETIIGRCLPTTSKAGARHVLNSGYTMSIQKPGRNKVKHTSNSAAADSTACCARMNQPWSPPRTTGWLRPRSPPLSSRCHSESMPISSNWVLKMNMKGEGIAVRIE